MLFTISCYSWFCTLVLGFLGNAVKFLLSLKHNSAVTRPLRFLPFTSFSRSIFSMHSNALSPFAALPPLQSHWPILWRTVKGRRSVYCLASFLGQWDSADVCVPLFHCCLGLRCGILYIRPAMLPKLKDEDKLVKTSFFLDYKVLFNKLFVHCFVIQTLCTIYFNKLECASSFILHLELCYKMQFFEDYRSYIISSECNRCQCNQLMPLLPH